MRLSFALACCALALLQPAAGMAQVNGPEASSVRKDGASANAAKGAAQPEREPLPVVQDYEPRPAMWTLADEDTKIHLFGTFHILPPQFRWRTDLFDRTIREVDELVVETSDADAEASRQRFAAAIAERVVGRAPTSGRLSPQNIAKWRQLARMSDSPYEAFDRMPVLLAMIGSGLTVARMQGSDHQLGVETVLEAEFAKAGKQVRSIEDGAAVLRALLAVEEDALIADLDRDLAEWDGVSAESLFTEERTAEPVPFEDEHRWARGLETAPIFTAEDLAQPVMRTLYDVLLTDRNTAWAEWLDDRLDRPGTLLVAVGAGHFEGEDSLIRKLADRGLTVKRVQ